MVRVSVISLTALAAALLALQPMQPRAAQPDPGAAAAGSYLRHADFRVATVTYRLASKGRALCGQTHPVTGLSLHHLADYSAADQVAADRRYGISKGPGVLAVVENSPAARSGLLAGDVILSVNGIAMPAPEAASAARDDKTRRRIIEAVEARLEEQLLHGPARLQVLRGAQVLNVSLDPEPGCPARGRLARSKQPNAFADGRYAIMTTRMLDFIRSDDELAVAMAHELAHNILRHPAELEEKGVPKGFLRNFGKNAASVRRTEEEADRLGIKLLWAAGYDVAAAIPFWRRLYAVYDPIPTPKLFRTHPSLSARERMIDETVAELRSSGSQPGSKRP